MWIALELDMWRFKEPRLFETDKYACDGCWVLGGSLKNTSARKQARELIRAAIHTYQVQIYRSGRMSDDALNASELRSRYNSGGSVRDCDLSAAQLRSRYAIPANTFKEQKSTVNPIMVIMILLVLAGLGGAAYLFS